MDLRETFEYVDWNQLAEDGVQWQTLVNTVISFQFYERRGIC
jgi:hypothetical protein